MIPRRSALALGGTHATGREWVDDFLLAGPGGDPCLTLGRRTTREDLRLLVSRRSREMRDAGIGSGTSVALRAAPSSAYVVHLLALLRSGARVTILDHRLTPPEVDAALERLRPGFVVRGDEVSGALRGFHEIDVRVETRSGGRPAETDHAVVQVSSGSTGTPKLIGRTLEDITREITCLKRVPGMPNDGESVVVLNSLLHSMGIFTGLFYDLHVGAEIVVPEWTTADGILETIARATAPTVVFGVPFHARLMSLVSNPPDLPWLRAMATAGEILPASVVDSFRSRYGVPLGNLYGMTEVGLIAVDPTGAFSPSAGPPIPGMGVRVENGELVVDQPTNPYLDARDSGRWSGGRLYTRDAVAIDSDTGGLTVLGRLDSQVSIGGLKVDLTEVELALTSLRGVRGGVVLHGEGIEAFVELDDGVSTREVEEGLAASLAPHKRPRIVHSVRRLARTTSGKVVRDIERLRAEA
ncbi:class I adenylate-forming enzyme family protein [Nocardiopsis alba]|uniref:class I adenylate-forming enzyme family protein n=1 Tax=Nocardiopsis alba TaxID=53437 RepID=UPI0035E0D783